MKIKILCISFCYFISLHNLFPQANPYTTNNPKLASSVVGLGTALYLSNLYIDDIWWGEKKTDFSFDAGRDAVYALNVDKCGHFIGGLIFSDIVFSTMHNSGMNHRKSYWIGAFSSTSLQLAIELKDAYSPYWGFSNSDLLSGTVGSFWPVLQYYNPKLKAINFKFSYFHKSDHYLSLNNQIGKKEKVNWLDNYPNQTYWMTININDLTMGKYLPNWLNLAFGFSIDDTQYFDKSMRKVGGKNEFYLAVDYDLIKIAKKYEFHINSNLIKWLNYFHFPAPTIRISPKFDWYPLFI